MTLPKFWTTVTPLSKTIALILFAFLPAIAFFLGVRYQQKLDHPNLMLSVTPASLKIIPTATIQEDETTNNWRTYKDEIYGFSVKYPAVGINQNVKRPFYNGVFWTPLQERNENLVIDGIVSAPSISSTYLGLRSTRKITINGLTWDILLSDGYCDAGICGEPFIAYQIIKNKSRITFIFTNTKEDSERNRKIISTIRITPQSCPKDVTHCNDGRVMGRTPPSCSFACQK